MNGSDLMFIYANVFNSPARSRNVYEKMMTKYDEFFDAEKKKVDARLTFFMAGKQINDIVKHVVTFYDQRDA